MLRLQGMHGEAYRHLTWAIDMLEAVDQEFKVSERRAFDECGSAFRPSIKRAVWQCADASHRDLRRVSQSFTLFKGAFPLIKEVEMAQKIIRSGDNTTTCNRCPRCVLTAPYVCSRGVPSA